MTNTSQNILITLKESDEAYEYNAALQILITTMGEHADAARRSCAEIVVTAAEQAVEIANEDALAAATLFERQLKRMGVCVISSWGEGNEWEVILDCGYATHGPQFIVAGMAAWELERKALNV
jgi:hypothetical protein